MYMYVIYFIPKFKYNKKDVDQHNDQHPFYSTYGAD